MKDITWHAGPPFTHQQHMRDQLAIALAPAMYQAWIGKPRPAMVEALWDLVDEILRAREGK